MPKIVKLTETEFKNMIDKAVLQEQTPRRVSRKEVINLITELQSIFVRVGLKQPVTGKIDEAFFVGLRHLQKLMDQSPQQNRQ